jgi:predicted extracellular nuclease
MNNREQITRLVSGSLAFLLALTLVLSFVLPVRAVSSSLVINEIDYDQPSTDTAEFVEIKNISADTVSLDGWTLELVQGTGGGASVYNSIALPNVSLAAGDYFVVCGDDASVANCDLDVSPDSNLIQNGAPDAVGLRDAANTLIDAVSYEGDSGAPYTEGSGGGLSDSSSAANLAISRFPDGVDTDQNNVDLSRRCITPGSANTDQSTGCVVVPTVTIPEIQGDGLWTPYYGQEVQTIGIVTADFQDTEKSGFFLQDPLGDGNPATSDGIFVYDRWFDVDEGDEIVITGQVGEYYDMTQLSGIWDRITVLSKGNPLPAPVELNDLPDESLELGIAFWEPLEGMLVSVQNAPVVGPTSGYGEFAVLSKADAKPGSGFYPEAIQILLRSLGPNVIDYNPERIVVDDSSLETPISVMAGDRVRSLIGPLDYTFSMYKIQPKSYEVKNHDLPNLPASTRSGPKGNTVITTFNVENLFDLADNPDKDDEGSTPTSDELETQLTKLSLAIQIELELPEIIVVQEIENTEIAQALGDRVNAAAGTGYVATSFETSDGRGIEVGFLWDANRVSLLEAYQLSGPDVDAAFGPGSASPGREPLYGKFQVDGKEIHIVGNHFKSKGGDDALFGMNQPPYRVTEEQRKLQAQVVRDFVDGIFAGDPSALVMVAGDLNDFQFGEPGEGADHPVAILEGVGGGIPLTNLVNLEKDDERYTYVYDGNSQVLDHTLVSPALMDLFVAVDVLHFNASYPDSLGADPSTPLRASDHDALESRFEFK